VANEPKSSASHTAPANQSHIRTFAQDVARLSGKPLPASLMKPVPGAPKPPVTGHSDDFLPKNKTVPPKPSDHASPPPPPVEKNVVPAPTPAPTPAVELPPARIIPKAPTTDETREAVLARLRKNAVPEPISPAEPASPAYVIPKAPSTNESKEDVLARLRAKAQKSIEESGVLLPEKESEATFQPALKPEPEQKKIPTPLSPLPGGPDRIHTYKTDFASHAKKTDSSKISVLAAQADAQPVQTVIFKEKKPFPFALLGGFLLIMVGGGALYGAYYYIQNQPVPVFVPSVPSLIEPDEHVELSRENVFNDFLHAISQPLEETAVRVVYTSLSTTTPEGSQTKIVDSGNTLIRALSLSMPEVLARSIQDESTVGVIRTEGEQRAFFILKVDSFERSFAGMLEWERDIATDLAELYPEYPLTQSATTTASTTPIAPTIAVALSSSFKDELIQNKDVRVLRDAENREIIVYGFRDKETLIITRNATAYLILTERLTASRGD